ncbi:MAG: TetR/AcrR family transcriptional regulator [Pyrinomonadaceae bacterium]
MSIKEKGALTATRPTRGGQTRQTILQTAVDVASEEGLEGLTIGRLATELGMSKSGLFAHFGSKEELQLATVEAAREVFIRNVITPAFASERGLARLWKLCEVWLDYAHKNVFRGGCFFIAASAEFDGRPGPVRERVAEIMREWLATLERTIGEAQGAGQLDRGMDPSQLAFEINALHMGANWAFQLYGDDAIFKRAREAVLARLRGVSAPDHAVVVFSPTRHGKPKVVNG